MTQHKHLPKSWLSRRPQIVAVTSLALIVIALAKPQPQPGEKAPMAPSADEIVIRQIEPEPEPEPEPVPETTPQPVPQQAAQAGSGVPDTPAPDPVPTPAVPAVDRYTNDEIVAIYAKHQDAINNVWASMDEDATVRDATLKWLESNSTDAVPAYEPRIIMYSPESWSCVYCGPQRLALEAMDDVPVDIEYKRRDGMGDYPQTWLSTPGGTWKFFVGRTSADTIRREWAKHHPDAGVTLAPEPEPAEIDRLRQMDAASLRKVIRGWGPPLPTSGTVVGQTVTQHLTKDHGFSLQRISGLTEAERHSLHQIAHKLTTDRPVPFRRKQR